MDDKSDKPRSHKKPSTNGSPKQGLPPRLINDAKAQLNKLNPDYKIVVEEGDARASVLEGNKIIAGPFTHSGSLLSWMDGYRVAKYVAEKNAKETKKDDPNLPAIHILTAGAGVTFFAYFLVNNKWEIINADGLPALSFGEALKIAVTHRRLRNFKVSFDDRTNETLAKEAEQQEAT